MNYNEQGLSIFKFLMSRKVFLFFTQTLPNASFLKVYLRPLKHKHLKNLYYILLANSPGSQLKVYETTVILTAE